MTLIKKEANEAKKAQARADYIAAVNREEREWQAEHQKEADEYAKKHNLVTVQDHINHIKNRWSAHKNRPDGKNSEPESVQKKKCIDCGSTNIKRQYDEGKSTPENIVWLDYLCLDCKERFVL